MIFPLCLCKKIKQDFSTEIGSSGNIPLDLLFLRAFSSILKFMILPFAQNILSYSWLGPLLDHCSINNQYRQVCQTVLGVGYHFKPMMSSKGFPGSTNAKEPACKHRRCGSGRSPGGGHGNPLQHSYLETCMDRGDCRAGPQVTKSQTGLQ